jgi:Fe(3+) dicitrate transport protein
LKGSATVLDTEIRAGIIDEGGSDVGSVVGNRAPYAPRAAWNVVLELAPANRLYITGGLHYVSSQFADFNNTIEETPSGDNGLIRGHSSVDATIRYGVPGRPIRLFVAAKNLTNKIYRGSRLHRSSSGIFPGGFRQVNVGMEWQM